MQSPRQKKHLFHEYILHDVLGGIPGVTSRAMFSGYALYQNRIIFGIIAENELYFKVDDSNRSDFEAFGMKPFSYLRKGKEHALISYYQVPEEIQEHTEKIRTWVEKAIRASFRSRKE